MNVPTNKLTDDATTLALLGGGQEEEEVVTGDDENEEGDERQTEEEEAEEDESRGDTEDSDDSPATKVYNSIVRLGQDPEYAREELPKIVKAVANAHGIDIEELLGIDTGASDRDEDWDVPALKKEISRLNDQVKAMQAKDAVSTAIDAAHPKLKKELQDTYGFVLTKGMLQDAIKKNPGLSPRQAAFAEYGERMVQVGRGQKPQLSPKGSRDASTPSLVRPKDLSLVKLLAGK